MIEQQFRSHNHSGLRKPVLEHIARVVRQRPVVG